MDFLFQIVNGVFKSPLCNLLGYARSVERGNFVMGVTRCKRLKKGYDRIAWIYDRLARVVYGSALIRAQQYLLQYVPPNSSVLIAGGGTGWIIDELSKLQPQGLNITYADTSARMIALARKRDAGSNKVNFITMPVETLRPEHIYDVIITPFLLDNFTDDMLTSIFPKIDALLKPGGLWLYCDFKDTGRPKHRLMLKIMYLFFRTTCGIAARRLPYAEGMFGKYHYAVQASQEELQGFVTSIIYSKPV